MDRRACIQKRHSAGAGASGNGRPSLGCAADVEPCDVRGHGASVFGKGETVEKGITMDRSHRSSTLSPMRRVRSFRGFLLVVTGLAILSAARAVQWTADVIGSTTNDPSSSSSPSSPSSNTFASSQEDPEYAKRQKFAQQFWQSALKAKAGDEREQVTFAKYRRKRAEARTQCRIDLRKAGALQK